VLEEFINKWGSTIGPSLAVLVSAFGFWVKSVRKNRAERKESLRRIEIGTTRSLNDVDKTRQKLENFVSRLRDSADNIKAITDSFTFSLDGTNFPSIREVYRDAEAPNFTIKSYYLHNKLLWIDAGIKEINGMMISFKNDFTELLRKNELHVILIKQNKTPDPTRQRMDYANNLESFANAIEKFNNEFIEDVVEIMAQVKIYNAHVYAKRGFLFLWKHEGTSCKFFRNEKERQNFYGNPDSLSRIDKVLTEEVSSLMGQTG
jgi:hypothetical protein